MANATQHQNNVTGKKSFGQTVAQSVRVMGGADVANYSLYFMNPTARKRAGEHETIVIPYIEIGRGSGCAVQFGDEFPTVGRKHAAIRFDNGRIVLKHLNQNNPSIVMKTDGTKAVLSTPDQEMPLENGYQVQFSYDGPMIRLNATPTATSKMGVTQRVQLALSQGVRPYRRAVAALALALFSIAGLSGYFINKQGNTIAKLTEESVEAKAHSDFLISELSKAKEEREKINENNTATATQIASANKRVKELEHLAAAALNKVQEIENKIAETSPTPPTPPTPPTLPTLPSSPSPSPTPPTLPSPPPSSSPVDSNSPSSSIANISNFKSSIYYIFPKSVRVRHPKVQNNEVIDLTNEVAAEYEASWSGTAFLTDERKLITARHVITPWRFPDNCNDVYALISQCELGGSVDATYSIIAPGGKEIESFTLSQVHTSATEDVKLNDACPGLQLMLCPDKGMYTDWAWVNMNIKGNITINRDLSENLSSGRKLEIYGYSKGLALQDSRNDLDPLYGVCHVAQDGLSNKIIRVGNRPFTGGASGGPVFAKEKGNYYAVGIISHGIDNIGGIVPVKHLK